MNRIDRYIVKRWLTLFLTSLAVLALAYLSTEITFKLWGLAERDIPASSLGLHFLLKFPTITYQVAPVASLLATLLTITGLKHTRELGALCCSGVSDFRIGIPIITASLIVSVLSFYVGERVAPGASKLSRDIARGGRGSESLLVGTDRIWLLEGNRVIHIRNVEKGGMLLIQPTVLEFSGKGLITLSKRIDAPKATWDGAAWIMDEGITRHFQSGRLSGTDPPGRIQAPIGIQPDEFFRVRRTPEEMDHKELSEYIANLKIAGLPYRTYEVQRYSRVSNALIPFIFGLLALPIGFQVPVRGGAPLGIGLSITMTIIYWSFLSLSVSLGESGILPAAVSAWAANALFLALGVLGFVFKRSPRLT